MLTINKPNIYNGNEIEINSYQANQVGLLNNTKLWMCFYPKIRNAKFCELIVSPIEFNAWEDLWEVKITVNEQVEIIKNIIEVLKYEKVNILKLENLSLDMGRLHKMELTIDARHYTSYLFDKSSLQRRTNLDINTLKDLRRKILAQIIEKIHFVNGQPAIKINRIKSLQNAGLLYNKLLDKNKEGAKPTVARGNSLLIKNKIQLPNAIKKTINEAIHSIEGENLNETFYFATADSNEKYLRIQFYSKKDKILLLNVKHQDNVGAISLIASALSLEGFNIFSSYSSIGIDNTGILSLLVGPEEINKYNFDELKTKLETTLSTKELVNKYETEIRYYQEDLTFSLWKKLVYIEHKERKYLPIMTSKFKLSKAFDKYNSIPENEITEREKEIRNLAAELLTEENTKRPSNDENPEIEHLNKEDKVTSEKVLTNGLEDIIKDITNGETEIGLSKLIILTKENKFALQDDVILLSNKFNRIKKDYNKRIVRDEDYSIESLKIAKSILSIINEIKDKKL